MATAKGPDGFTTSGPLSFRSPSGNWERGTMTTGNANLEEMTDEELEAAQRAADGEAEGTNPPVGEEATTATAEGTATAADTTLNADAAATTAGADATVDPQTAKVEGIASKDGSRILPYAALQAERRAHRTANARYESTARELEQAKQLIADLKAGKTPAAELTEADVVQMEQDFPEHGEKMRAIFNKAQAFDAAQKTRQGTAATEDAGEDTVQDTVDQVPLLVEWQASDPEKFLRACAHDEILMNSPKWRDKPAIERFTQAAKLTADEYDIAFPDPKASAKPKPSTAQQIASAAPRAAPNTLSDFKGGAVADHGTANVKNMSSTALLNRYESMSDAEIDAELARLG